MTRIDYDLLSIQEARVLTENAREAQKILAGFSQERLDAIVNSMASEIAQHTEDLAKMSCEETEFGKWQDKLIKNNFVCNCLPQRLQGQRFVGIIDENPEEQTKDIGVPVGVIAALPPSTSPVSTTIYKTLIAVKSGNAIVFSPHPRAKKCIGRALDILIDAGERSGLPKGAVSYLHTLTTSGTSQLFNHPDTSMLLVTGVPKAYEAAKKTGKPLLYGGLGNGPVFIERTANVQQAVCDIVARRTFDNGMVSASEQTVVVDSCIAQLVRDEFGRSGAYFMSDAQSEALGALFHNPDGAANVALVGQPASVIAAKAGFSVPPATTVLIAEQKYALPSNPYIKNKLCPVLAFFVEDDWMHACEKCIELLVSEGRGHTLIIHSNDEDVIREFALKKPVSRVLVNTPGTFGGMGATTNLFPAMTLGSGAEGGGVTSDNISPLNLINIRKVGYGVRSIHQISTQWAAPAAKTESAGVENSHLVEVLQSLLRSIT